MRDVPEITVEEFERRRLEWMNMIGQEVTIRRTWKPILQSVNLVVCSEASKLFFGFAEAAQWLCGHEDKTVAQGILRACRSPDGRAYRDLHWVLLPPAMACRKKVDGASLPRNQLATTAEFGDNTTTATGSTR